MSSRISNPPLPILIVTKDHDDFDAADVTNTINIGAALPDNTRVISVSCECTEAPGGGTIATYGIDVGDATDPNGYIEEEDMVAGGVGVYELLGEYFTVRGNTVAAGTQITATATSTVGDLDEATTGEWTFRISYVQF